MIVNHVTVFRFSSERVKLNCVTLNVNFESLYLKKLRMIHNKVVLFKHFCWNRFTVQNNFVLFYNQFAFVYIF